MKIHGFQAKWSILWPHSWHSLFKWSHILHKGASWNSKQRCLRKFSFCLHGKFIFHFSSARNEVFLWRTYHIFVAKLYQINFLKYQAMFNAQLTKWLVSKVSIHFWWKRQISTNPAWSGSSLNCSCLIVCSLFFPKIISSYISIYLIINTWFGGDTSRFGRWPRAQL